MTDETFNPHTDNKEQTIMDEELERMAAELEITVDYLMAEFL